MSQNNPLHTKNKGGRSFSKFGLFLIATVGISLACTFLFSSGQMISYRYTHAITRLRDLQIHILSFSTRANGFPEQLQDLVFRPSQLKNEFWRQYAKRDELFDPWGQPFVYRVPGKRNPNSYDLFSLGPDGLEGTQDDIWGDYYHLHRF